METAFQSYSRVLGIPLLAVALIATAPLVLESDGPFHQWAGLDFSYLVVPLVLFGALALASRLALLAQLTRFGAGLVWNVQLAGRAQHIPLLVVGHRLFLGLGWMALVYGMLASVPQLTATVSAHPDFPKLTGAEPYLAAFSSLSLWAILLLAPFVLANSVAEVWPREVGVVGFPVSRLIAFGAVYLLLADGGLFSTALDLSGTLSLVAFGFAFGLSYLASCCER